MRSPTSVVRYDGLIEILNLCHITGVRHANIDYQVQTPALDVALTLNLRAHYSSNNLLNSNMFLKLCKIHSASLAVPNRELESSESVDTGYPHTSPTLKNIMILLRITCET
jgi:hypothetical protein